MASVTKKLIVISKNVKSNISNYKYAVCVPKAKRM